MARSVSRRTFLKATAAAGAALTAPAFISARGANEKLNIASIGCGNRGASNLKGIDATGENITALCDVNRLNIDQAAVKHPKAVQFEDYRKLYDQAKLFDAVVVSTPEHTHAFATLPALQLGKHVYCEKPLTHNIAEARIIRETAAKNPKLATQMGTQIHATDNYRRVVELVQAGAIGPVREAHVWVSRAWGLQSLEESRVNEDSIYGKELIGLVARPKESVVPPASLNWDLWLGPAPERPFHPVYVPGSKWYRWWDFGNGTMSDLGSHFNDLPFWALKLHHPLTIQAFGPTPDKELAPASMHVEYQFPARGDMPPVKMTWYQGADKPTAWTEKTIPQWKNGVLFIGDKGMLLSDYTKHMLLPEKQFADFKRPEQFISKSLGHYAEWVHACKTGAPTLCNFEYAGLLTESNHLGNVAFRAGKKLEWDTKTMKATNCSAADAFIHREYRKGWKLV